MAKKILIIDDDHNLTHTLKMVLDFEGHNVRVINDGNRVEDHVAEFEPQIVICDLHLAADCSGYEIVGRLRKRFDAALKIVALSGDATQETTEKVKSAGFNHFLTKPITPEQLRGVIADS